MAIQEQKQNHLKHVPNYLTNVKISRFFIYPKRKPRFYPLMVFPQIKLGFVDFRGLLFIFAGVVSDSCALVYHSAQADQHSLLRFVIHLTPGGGNPLLIRLTRELGKRDRLHLTNVRASLSAGLSKITAYVAKITLLR